MRKIWLITTTTYRQRVRSGLFLLLTFGLPLSMIVAGAAPMLMQGDGDLPAQIGFVDETGALAPVGEVAIDEVLLDSDRRLSFAPFPDRDTAQAAFLDREIGGYLLVPADYFQGEAVTYFAQEEPDAVIEAGIEIFLQRGLLGEQPEWAFERLQDPAVYSYTGLTAAVLALWGEISLASVAIPWTTLLWGLALIIPGYFLFSFLAAGLGIIGTDSQQAQQLAGLVGIFGLAPLWILGLIVSNPDGPLAVGLTIFLLTAPGVALVRMIFADVSAWQLAGSLAVLLLTLVVAIWFVAKIFRAAMLHYGQALRPRQIWQVLMQA